MHYHHPRRPSRHLAMVLIYAFQGAYNMYMYFFFAQQVCLTSVVTFAAALALGIQYVYNIVGII